MKIEQFLIKLGKQIKKYRIDKDFSQENLATKANMHVTYISKIERGKAKVTIEYLLKICDAFNIQLKDLVDIKE